MGGVPRGVVSKLVEMYLTSYLGVRGVPRGVVSELVEMYLTLCCGCGAVPGPGDTMLSESRF